MVENEPHSDEIPPPHANAFAADDGDSGFYSLPGGDEAVDNESSVPAESAAGPGLIYSTEGRIFLLAVFLSVAYVLWLLILSLDDIERFDRVVGMTAAHIASGRAGGMLFGYTARLPHGIVVPANLAIEVIVVLFFYPLFVWSWRRLVVFEFLKTIMQRTHDAADRHHETIRRYGVIGLFLFVWFPFWMTGPVVGCAIGFLIGIRPLVNLGVVIGGTAVAILCWALVLKELHDAVAEYGPYASLVLLLLVIGVAVTAHCLTRSGASGKNPGPE